MSFTVVPIHNLELEPKTRIPFGNGFVLQDVPNWLKTDEGIVNNLQYTERCWNRDAKHAWVAEYNAESIGHPDPDWNGDEPKSIQETKFASVILANLAMWFMEPTNICFTNGFHAVSWSKPGQSEKLPIAQQIMPSNRLLCHPKDTSNTISIKKIVEAGSMHVTLCGVPREPAVWTALRATWAALTMNSADIRYSLFWIALEAIFGADDSREIGYKLGQRIAFFLADTPADARDLFKKVKTCYNMRSKIVHGRWSNDKTIDEVMYYTERIVGTVFRRLVRNQPMLNTFISKKRDSFLEDWVFSRAIYSPPFPVR